MSLNDSLNELERSKLAVWDYPVSDKYTKVSLYQGRVKRLVTLDALQCTKNVVFLAKIIRIRI